MDNIRYQITQDGSVGLYDNEAKDILHSVTGALRESLDKFIYPTGFETYCTEHNMVKVLDICFGIGYNSKAAISSSLKNNSDIKIYISALEINRHFVFISPFIKDGLNEPEINLFLLSYFIYNFEDFTDFVSGFFKTHPDTVSQFFDDKLCLVFENFMRHGGMFNHPYEVYSFLHNIYYQNISISMENAPKPFKFDNITFELLSGDARLTLQILNNKYNFVFLDGYTPHKQPLLWTYNFLELVKSKMEPDGILSTYSNSTPVRKSLSDLNLYLGKIFFDDTQYGTIASLDKSKIKLELNDYDLGLMNTRAGLPYYDNNFSLTAEEILAERETRIKMSDKMSSTEYKKRYAKCSMMQ